MLPTRHEDGEDDKDQKPMQLNQEEGRQSDVTRGIRRSTCNAACSDNDREGARRNLRARHEQPREGQALLLPERQHRPELLVRLRPPCAPRRLGGWRGVRYRVQGVEGRTLSRPPSRSTTSPRLT